MVMGGNDTILSSNISANLILYIITVVAYHFVSFHSNTFQAVTIARNKSSGAAAAVLDVGTDRSDVYRTACSAGRVRSCETSKINS